MDLITGAGLLYKRIQRALAHIITIIPMQIMIILQFYATGTFQLMPNEDSFGLSLSLICQPTSEDIKHHFIMAPSLFSTSE